MSLLYCISHLQKMESDENLNEILEWILDLESNAKNAQKLSFAKTEENAQNNSASNDHSSSLISTEDIGKYLIDWLLTGQ